MQNLGPGPEIPLVRVTLSLHETDVLSDPEAVIERASYLAQQIIIETVHAHITP